MKKIYLFLVLALILRSAAFSQADDSNLPRVKTLNGTLTGVSSSGVKIFKGVPFAAPPIGNLRWKEPQPVKNWEGIRKSDKFGPRAMQRALFSDMNFRSNGVNEDCLYLNIWTPSQTGKERLPVLVYFYGGGFVAGDGSELRYDGESMARKGIIAITVNYRLSVFGFFSHPELTKESPHHASGNYGLLDQAAALKWVQANIAAFGGDPKKITIAGESAGSFSVSAQMASPLSRGIIAGAIGESGSLVTSTSTVPLAQAEQLGKRFGDTIGATSLAALRAIPAEQILQATARPGLGRFPVTVDGYFFPLPPVDIFNKGQQAHVPLLVGWNSEENNYTSILGKDQPSLENFTKAIEKIYGDKGASILKVYHPVSDNDVPQVATNLASDRFIGFGTWKWSDVQSKTGGSPVYRYFYERPRPATREETRNRTASPERGAKSATSVETFQNRGAVHSAEIEYAMGNLPTNIVFDWQADDYKVSEILQSYFVNFVKTGNPNGLGVPVWLPVTTTSQVPVMHINVNAEAQPDKNKARYQLLDELSSK